MFKVFAVITNIGWFADFVTGKRQIIRTNLCGISPIAFFTVKRAVAGILLIAMTSQFFAH
mgnify:CR=1 FL=1